MSETPTTVPAPIEPDPVAELRSDLAVAVRRIDKIGDRLSDLHDGDHDLQAAYIVVGPTGRQAKPQIYPTVAEAGLNLRALAVPGAYVQKVFVCADASDDVSG
jgi:hypothetical protein